MSCDGRALDRDADGAGGGVQLFDADADAEDPLVAEQDGGDPFGESLDELDVAGFDEHADGVGDDVVGERVAQVVGGAGRAAEESVDVEADALGGVAFPRVGADAAGQHEIVDEHAVGRAVGEAPGGGRVRRRGRDKGAHPARGGEGDPGLFAQGPPKPEQAGVQDEQAGNVGRFECAGEAAGQAVREGVGDETGEGGHADVIEQPAAPLPGGVEHDAGEAGFGEAREQLEGRGVAGGEHGDEADAVGERGQVGQRSGLIDFDPHPGSAGVGHDGDRVRRARSDCGAYRAAAGHGGDRVPHRLRAWPRTSHVDDVGAAGEGRFDVGQAGDAGEHQCHAAYSPGWSMGTKLCSRPPGTATISLLLTTRTHRGLTQHLPARAGRHAVLMSLACLSACAVGPDFKQPSLWSPASWFNASSPAAEVAARRDATTLHSAGPVDLTWWDSFRDPVLSSLVRRAGSLNLDVQTATERLAQSRAQRSVASAAELPTANGNGSYTRERISPRGVSSLFGGGGAGQGSGDPATQSNGLGGRQGGIPASATGGRGIPPFNLFQYGFDASWELDLWGRVRRSVESADAAVTASTEARRDALLSSEAEVARDYIQLRGIQRQQQVTRDNLRTARDSAYLTRERQKGGLASDLDVANADATVAAEEAQLPQLGEQEGQTINALSFLLGETPGALTSELATPKPVPPLPRDVPLGLPSQLTERRPDIRQAAAQLHAATADIGVAEADFFPRVTLSGSLAIQALQFKDLGNWASRTYGIGPSISVPIFEGGRLRATLELRRAQQREAAIAYRRTVLTAFREVDDALIAYHSEQTRRASLEAAAQANRQAVELASLRFRRGVDTFLQVLTAERSLLVAEQQLATSTAQAATDLVQLYKALGGGWKDAEQHLASAR